MSTGIEWTEAARLDRLPPRDRLLPMLVGRERDPVQAMLEGDSFKSFFAQEVIVTGTSTDRLAWTEVLDVYKQWCSGTGRKLHTIPSPDISLSR